MRPKRWLELVKDCDCNINYDSCKANVVDVSLSRKFVGYSANILMKQGKIQEDLSKLDIETLVSQQILDWQFSSCNP